MSTFYTFEEILEKTGITDEELDIWEKAGLLSPLGRSEENKPFFDQDHIEKIEKIKKFLELGYCPDEIQKIIRKVGLPSKDKEKNRLPEKNDLLTVGVLAEKTATSPRTIKHWEEKGIIEPDMRSQGGFRLYNRNYIYLTSLIKDLQHFGYTLDEIKIISDFFRDFFQIRKAGDEMPAEIIEKKISGIVSEIEKLHDKISILKDGIVRWEDLVKKNKKEISAILARAKKQMEKKEKQDDPM